MPHLLVVEDDPDHADLFAWILHSAGHTRRLAGAGEDALSLLEAESFDLVLVDLRLSDTLDGFDVIRSIRRLAQYELVPGLVVTVRPLFDIVEHAFEVGADHVMGKPLMDFDAFLMTIETFLSVGRVEGRQLYARPRSRWPG